MGLQTLPVGAGTPTAPAVPSAGARTAGTIALAVALLSLGALLAVAGRSSYRSTAEFHEALELAGSLLGFLAGYVLIARFLAGARRVDLFLGLAFASNAAGDLAHGFLPMAVTRGWIHASRVEFATFSPATFTAGRFMLATLMLLAVAVPGIRTGLSAHPSSEARRSLVLTATAMLTLTTAAFLWAAPRASYADATVHRPADLAVAGILVATLWVLHRHPLDVFGGRWIVASVAIGIVGQTAISLSSNLFDGPFDIGHLAKVLGYFVVIAGFIGGQVRVLARERETIEALRRTDEARTAFVNTVSHELRTPLTAIRGFTRFLEEDPPAEERRDHVERIQRNAHVLQNLVEDVLAFSRIDTDQQMLVARPIGLASAIQTATDALGSLLAEHDLRIDLEVERAVADERALGQVLRNLLANAAHYAPKDTVIRVRATADSSDAGRFVRLTVDDAGPGVPLEERNVIFERFRRGEAALDSRIAGTGIGLAVASALTEAMGGTVHVEDATLGGASFVVRLPAA